MKRFMVIVLSVILTATLAACASNGGTSEGVVPNASEEVRLTDDAIKVDEVKYEVSAGVVDGSRRAVFSYSNDSNYTIVGVRLELVPREDAEDESIEEAFDYMIDYGITVDDIREGMMVCEYSFAVDPGQTSNDRTVNYLGYYVINTQQYDLMQPDMLTIQFLYDGLIYEEYYDYKTDTYSLSTKVVDPDQWGDSELSDAAPRPDGALVVDARDYESQFTFEVQGMTEDAYQAYVAACKEAGFTEDVAATDSTYYADNSNGEYKISLFYWPSSGSLSVYVDLLDD